MRILTVAFAVCLSTLITGAPGSKPARPEADLEALHWLSGSWTGSAKGVDMEEHWSAADGGLMTGMHRDVSGGKVVLFEFLRIEERDGTLIYIALPEGGNETEFPLKSIDSEEVVFENPEHDFPQRIIYRRTGRDLTARVEGDVDGKEESYQWKWERGRLGR